MQKTGNSMSSRNAKLIILESYFNLEFYSNWGSISPIFPWVLWSLRTPKAMAGRMEAK